MRLVILSDSHGNPWALRAVLRDAVIDGAADAYWILGDLVALGPDPGGVLAQLDQLPNARYVRGNTDRYTATGDRPFPAVEDVHANPDLIIRYGEVAGSFAWTQGFVTALGRLDWLPSTRRGTPAAASSRDTSAARFVRRGDSLVSSRSHRNGSTATVGVRRVPRRGRDESPPGSSADASPARL